MAEIAFRADLKLADKTAAAIDAAVLKRSDDGLRPHLGASLIGRSCNRALWYGFRWTTKMTHEARLLRLFGRGHREEATLTQLLRDAGITVMTVDPNTGRQFDFRDGHFGGSMDGACVGLPEAAKTWHVVEYKTASLKMFNKLVAEGVKLAKPEHYAQMQVYMLKMSLERAVYITVCKDDDRLHIERIDFDADFANSMVVRAQWIISLPTPPDGISTDPSWFECKWCDHKDVCHGSAAPLPTCRSCTHSTPERDGTWNCGWNKVDLSVADQKDACTEHRYIPILLKNWADPVDADAELNFVQYQLKSDGFAFINGAPVDGFSSQELYALQDKTMLSCQKLLELRKQFDGRLVA
jgi:hypothetical protein